MTADGITYGDISCFLQSLGFVKTVVPGSHVPVSASWHMEAFICFP